MKVSRILLSLVIPAWVTMMSGCANPFKDLLGSPTAPSNNTPSTDTFNGSLAPSGALVFTFSVATAGNVAVTLTAVSPATTSPLGLGVGPSSNGNCTIANSTSGAIAAGSPQLSATQNPGSYCVKVSDAGNLTTMSTVTVTVTHP
jgi:hypothetical protein